MGHNGNSDIWTMCISPKLHQQTKLYNNNWAAIESNAIVIVLFNAHGILYMETVTYNTLTLIRSSYKNYAELAIYAMLWESRDVHGKLF